MVDYLVKIDKECLYSELVKARNNNKLSSKDLDLLANKLFNSKLRGKNKSEKYETLLNMVYQSNHIDSLKYIAGRH
jgi:hypothetical protein